MFFGYSLVFAWTPIFEANSKYIKTEILFKESKNIYLDSLKLKKNKLLIKSWDDLVWSKIKSSCEIYSKLTHNKWNYYIFDFKIFNNSCDDEYFILVDSNGNQKLKFKINLINNYKILSKFLDLDTKYLLKLKNILDEKISLYLKYDKYDKIIEKNYYSYLRKNRILNEATYNLDIINNILNSRNEKYRIPVIWKKIPENIVKIPNSGRGYRKEYTDWIHHWWDIDWDFWEQIVALDDWIIIRTVWWFIFNDLNKIKKWSNLTKYDKIKNLDILRWNQVWLKTMKWDIVFYSHLNEIFSNIKSWEIVSKWQPIWTIWITWVPDKNYKDFHIHFPIHMNPFNLWKNESYDLDDYMKWDWLFKNETEGYILENQKYIFDIK